MNGNVAGSAADLVLSPELVLVDPELAEIARALSEHPLAIAAAPQARAEESPAPPGLATAGEAPVTTVAGKRAGPDEEAAVSRRADRRIALWVALPAAFVAGAFMQVGVGEIGHQWDRGSAALADAPAPAMTAASGPQIKDLGRTGRARQASMSSRGEPSGLAAVTRTSRWLRTDATRQPQGERPPSVLGVVVTSTADAVRLTWSRPPSSHHVRIVRVPGLNGSHSMIVFQGRSTVFLDRRVRSGRTYRYVIRNYDRRGRASTGVTTVIVVKSG